MTGHVIHQLVQVLVEGQWLGLDQYEFHLTTGKKLYVCVGRGGQWSGRVSVVERHTTQTVHVTTPTTCTTTIGVVALTSRCLHDLC